MKTKYRYREMTGCTRYAIRGLKHLPKLGQITEIVAYQYAALHKFGPRTDTRIKVVGDKGVALFWGFGYGYGGTGPHGLLELFKAVNVPVGEGTIGEECAFHIPMSDGELRLGHPRIDWRLRCDYDGRWMIDYRSDVPEGPVDWRHEGF